MAWKIDTAHTQVTFSVKHMMIATVRGHFTRFDGKLNFNLEQPELSTVEGTIETASIDTHDPNRDGHLRSPDFFDSETYPVMSFRSTKVTRAGEGEYKVAGLLTIKDVTREVVFDVTHEGQGKDPWGNVHLGLTATTTINRKDFGLNWNVALETGGWLVADQIKVSIDLEALYQPEAAAESEGQATAAAAA